MSKILLFLLGLNAITVFSSNNSEDFTYLNKPIPAIKSETIDGESWLIEDHLGKVIVINFWATWCEPCMDKIPKLKSVIEKYKEQENIYFVNVSFDDDKEILSDTIQEYELFWDQLFEGEDLGENSFSEKLTIKYIPTIWIINKNGIVVSVDEYELDDSFESKLNTLILE